MTNFSTKSTKIFKQKRRPTLKRHGSRQNSSITAFKIIIRAKL
jgi:hypothetical protein